MKLYAFWPYEDYYLGGVVSELRDDGKVKIEGYGSSIFTPVMITSYNHGVKVHNELAILIHARRKSIAELNVAFRAGVDALGINRGGKNESR